MKTKRRKLIDKLDSLWREEIRKRGSCERCGKKQGLQAAHIFSRSNYSTRWVKENGLCLCKGCHLFWAHKNPIEFAEFVREKLGEDAYHSLRLLSNQPIKLSNNDLIYLEEGMKLPW